MIKSIRNNICNTIFLASLVPIDLFGSSYSSHVAAFENSIPDEIMSVDRPSSEFASCSMSSKNIYNLTTSAFTSRIEYWDPKPRPQSNRKLVAFKILETLEVWGCGQPAGSTHNWNCSQTGFLSCGKCRIVEQRTQSVWDIAGRDSMFSGRLFKLCWFDGHQHPLKSQYKMCFEVDFCVLQWVIEVCCVSWESKLF